MMLIDPDDELSMSVMRWVARSSRSIHSRSETVDAPCVDHAREIKGMGSAPFGRPVFITEARSHREKMNE